MNTIEQARETAKSLREHARGSYLSEDVPSVIEALIAELADERIRGLQLLADAKEWQQMLMKERAELAALKEQEPVAYLAWQDGKPCWEGDDCVCADAVYPVDSDDDRTSMPLFLAAGAQEVSHDDVEFRQFLSDTLTAAGLVEHGKQSKGLAERLATGVMRYLSAPVQAQEQRKPLTDDEIDALELPPSGTATVRDLVRLIEAAHGIKE